MLSTGAVIIGRHTFELAGEWGGDHHDGVPIFVLTRTVPELGTSPVIRPRRRIKDGPGPP